MSLAQIIRDLLQVTGGGLQAVMAQEPLQAD